MISNEKSFIIGELDSEIRQLKAENDRLREALKRINDLRATVIQSYNPLALLDARVVKQIAKQALTPQQGDKLV